MTDNEIIKALECCFTNDFGKTNCNKCAFYTATAKCMDDMQNAVIDLINRQKAEIEQWKEEADRWQNAFCKVNEDMSTIKSEAIKEFAERLKEKLQWDVEFYNKIVFEDDIDNLVKEMTEKI